VFLKVDRESHCEGGRAAFGRRAACCVTAPHEGFRADKWSPGGWLAGRVGGAETVCWEANDCIATLCIAALCALIWPVPGVPCFKACLTEATVIVWLKRCQACWRNILSYQTWFYTEPKLSFHGRALAELFYENSVRISQKTVRLHFKNQVRKIIFLDFKLSPCSECFMLSSG